VSGGFGGFHYFQLRRFKDVGSASPCCRSTISLSIQNPELVKKQCFRLSGPPGRHKSDNRNLTLSDIAETESREGVMKLRVLIRWRQLAIGQFLLA
jgi:hypothetical protein